MKTCFHKKTWSPIIAIIIMIYVAMLESGSLWLADMDLQISDI